MTLVCTDDQLMGIVISERTSPRPKSSEIQ